MFKILRNYFRLIYIGYVFLKNRKNLAFALEELGPAFIKLGQFLSTRPDLVGVDFTESLSYLRDKLPYFSFTLVQKIILEEFGQEIEQLFKEFKEIPVAAASIAQVHEAITIDDKKVAVKVRRPNIEKQLAKEVEFFYFIANKIEKYFPRYKRLKLNEVVATLENSFKFELDLRLEAAAADELLKNNKFDYVLIPKIYWLYTSEKVLTMEWVDAVSIYERDILIKQEIDLTKLATSFAVMFFNQAFEDGFFHADLHQGNIMVTSDGKLVLLDYGIMGRLDYNNRLYVAKILHGFLKRDYYLIAKIHKDAGYIKEDCILGEFAQACRAIGEPIMNLSAEKISIAKLLGQLFKITEDFQMETQPQLLLLQKTMIMVEGVGKILSPEKNLWILSEDWIKEWAEKNLAMEARAAKAIKQIIHKLLEKIENLEL